MPAGEAIDGGTAASGGEVADEGAEVFPFVDLGAVTAGVRPRFLFLEVNSVKRLKFF